MLTIIKENINEIILLFLIVIYAITELILKRNLVKVKKEITNKYTEDQLESIEKIDSLDQDLYIEYYKRKNLTKYLRFAFILIFIWSLIITKIPSLFSSLAIAIWAIIITFKETILSFFSFFYVSAHYKIWENIIIWELKWEIIYINLINIWLIWKNEYSEHNWQFYTIPNYKFILDIVKREELWIGKYRKEEFEIYFNNNDFNINYEDFLLKLKHFLDEHLVKRNINNVGSYKTFIGYKYKIRFKYEKEYLIIKISLIDKQKALLELQNKLALFVESHKNSKNNLELNKI